MTKSNIKSVSFLALPFILFPILSQVWFYIASRSPEMTLGSTFWSKIYSASFWLIYLIPPVFFIPVIVLNARQYKNPINPKEKILSLIFLTISIAFLVIYLVSFAI